MNNLKQIKKAALVTGVLGMALVGQASAQDEGDLCLNNAPRATKSGWTLDLSGVWNGGAGKVIRGIDELNFLASTQVIPLEGAGIPGVAAGDTFAGYAVGRITDFSGGGHSVRTSTYGVNWEVTFEINDVQGIFTAGLPTATWKHDIPGALPDGGVLTLYAGPTVPAFPAGLADIETGQKIRRTEIGKFLICTSDACKADAGGVLHLGTNDGSEDATYTLISAPAGIWKDSNGEDLSLPGKQLQIHTDSNFDGDPRRTGNPFSYLPPLFNANGGANDFGVRNCGTLIDDTCVRNDGSATISVIHQCETIHKWYFGKQNPPFNADSPKLPVPIYKNLQVKDEFKNYTLSANFLQGLWNPARKDNGDPGDGHYSCYGVSAFGSPGKVNFETTNFGLDTAQVGVPRELCISAYKDAVANPIPAAPAPEPAYLCYGAKSGQDGFPQMHQIEDLNLHFAQTNLPTTDRSIQGLAMFCTPVGLNGNPAPNIGQEDPADPKTWMHKACYEMPHKVYPNPFIKVNLLDKFIQDAVGQDIIFSAEQERRFCEPARKLP